MRPIKFRAWDKENKEWTGAEYWYEEVGLNYSVRPPSVLKMSGKDSHVIMQYTGLKDKNGVEVYEGDVVEHTDNFSNITTINKVYWKGGSLVFDVVVDEGLVYDVPLYKITEDNAEGYDDELEVLGNIYENPELLEESK